jgi:hypothetical protein
MLAWKRKLVPFRDQLSSTTRSCKPRRCQKAQRAKLYVEQLLVSRFSFQFQFDKPAKLEVLFQVLRHCLEAEDLCHSERETVALELRADQLRQLHPHLAVRAHAGEPRFQPERRTEKNKLFEFVDTKRNASGLNVAGDQDHVAVTILVSESEVLKTEQIAH